MRLSFIVGAVLAAVLALPSLAAAADDPVGGTWIIKGRVATFAFTQTCQFVRQGEALSGTCYDTGTNRAHPLIAGSVSEDKVTWTFRSSFLLKSFDVSFSGALDDTGIRGLINASGHTGAFTATRS